MNIISRSKKKVQQLSSGGTGLYLTKEFDELGLRRKDTAVVSVIQNGKKKIVIEKE